jgi:STAS domain
MARAAQYQGSVSSDVVARGTGILPLDGELDVSNAGDFERRLPEASGPEPTDILLDLRGVSFLAAFPPSPSSAASALAAAQHAYVGAAVTEITTLRADLLDPQLG